MVDTTNQFGPSGVLRLHSRTAARYSADRMPGAVYTKCFNTLTAGFQAAAATPAATSSCPIAARLNGSS